MSNYFRNIFSIIFCSQIRIYIIMFPSNFCIVLAASRRKVLKVLEKGLILVFFVSPFGSDMQTIEVDF